MLFHLPGGTCERLTGNDRIRCVVSNLSPTVIVGVRVSARIKVRIRVIL
jgi:hypothetical protein